MNNFRKVMCMVKTKRILFESVKRRLAKLFPHEDLTVVEVDFNTDFSQEQVSEHHSVCETSAE